MSNSDADPDDGPFWVQADDQDPTRRSYRGLRYHLDRDCRHLTRPLKMPAEDAKRQCRHGLCGRCEREARGDPPDRQNQGESLSWKLLRIGKGEESANGMGVANGE